MPGPGTGETYSFPEGKLYLYASASGTTSGSGVGFAQDATLRFSYGWKDRQDLDNGYRHVLTGRRADLTINALYMDRTIFNIANASAVVNARFEGLVTALGTKSAQFLLYSGVIDQLEIEQSQGALFKVGYTMHANLWSAFGQ